MLSDTNKIELNNDVKTPKVKPRATSKTRGIFVVWNVLLAIIVSQATSMLFLGGYKVSQSTYLLDYALLLSNFMTGSLSGFLMDLVLTKNKFGDKMTPVGYSTSEEKVIEVLKSAGGTLPQSEIQSTTGFSKSKTSMVLSGLERRGTLKKQKSGRCHIVCYTGD